MATTAAGPMNRRIRIERPVADDSFDGAGSGEWVEVKEVWAEVQDALPSRAEKLADGINMSARPARVRIRARPGIVPSMRFALLRKSGGITTVERVMEIVAGPASIEGGARLEFMTEEYSPAGNGA